MQISAPNSLNSTQFRSTLKHPPKRKFNISIQKNNFYIKDAKEIRHGVSDAFKALVSTPISAFAFEAGNQSLGIVMGFCGALWGVCSLLAFACGVGKKQKP